MTNTWKNIERYTAKLLGGTRNSRGANFGKAGPDVEHPLFSVECKYRKQLPKLVREGLAQASRYDHHKPPLLIVKERGMHGALAVMKLSDFVTLVGALRITEEHT